MTVSQIAKPPAGRDAYPKPLREAEQALLKKHPGYDLRGASKQVRFGLSGGGVRSATFCLGVFQALGKLGLLKDIDYVSSVSGGSYFTAFYGRLFTRNDVQHVEQVAGILAPNESEPANGGANAWMREAFRWLRENGRYLSPRGAGDLLLDISVVLRNWLSLQVIVATFVLMFLLATQLTRVGLHGLVRSQPWMRITKCYTLFMRARERSPDSQFDSDGDAR